MCQARRTACEGDEALGQSVWSREAGQTTAVHRQKTIISSTRRLYPKDPSLHRFHPLLGLLRKILEKVLSLLPF